MTRLQTGIIRAGDEHDDAVRVHVNHATTQHPSSTAAVVKTKVNVKIKTPNSQITVKLPVISLSEDDNNNNIVLDESLLSFHELPLSVLKHMGPLRHLVHQQQQQQQQPQQFLSDESSEEEIHNDIHTTTTTTTTTTCITNDDIVQARLRLQRWFNEELGYVGYKLRHIIPRSSTSSSTNTRTAAAAAAAAAVNRGDMTKSSTMHSSTHSSSSSSSTFCARRKNSLLAIQRPVQRFHTDSTHTAFTNIWLPISDPVTDYFLGFLYDHSLSSLLTADRLEAICTRSSSSSSTSTTTTTAAQRSFLEENCSILYHDATKYMRYGHAIVFRSGGKHGVLHGSFCLHSNDDDDDDDVENNNNNNIGHRESVEFRCQKLDDSTGQWVYGEV